MGNKYTNISVFHLSLFIILQGSLVYSQKLEGDIKSIGNLSEQETKTTLVPVPQNIVKLFNNSSNHISNATVYNLKTSNESESATNTAGAQINRPTISVPNNPHIAIQDTPSVTTPLNINFSNITNAPSKDLPISQEARKDVRIPVVKNDKIVSNAKDVPNDNQPTMLQLGIPTQTVTPSTAAVPPKQLAMEGGGSIHQLSSVTSGTIATEGGFVDIHTFTKIQDKDEIKSNAKKILNSASNLSKEPLKPTAGPSVTARKGAIYEEGNITNTSLESSNNLSNNSIHEDCTCCSNMSESAAPNNMASTEINCTLCCGEYKLHGSGIASAPGNVSTYTPEKKVKFPPKASLETGGKLSSSSDSKTSLPVNKNNINSANSDTSTKKKPLVTSDIDDLPTKPLPAEASTSPNNYIIPIIGIIFTIPLVVVLAMFLYKKGAEFWERRHYRRMDFLIDGMYND